MNTTGNDSSCSSPLSPNAEKIGKTVAYSLILAVSLIGNFFIIIIVYRTQTLRKPVNFFIVNMAISDLLVSIIVLPWMLKELYVDYWLKGGPLGVAFCKLVFFIPDVSNFVSIQSLVLIAVDRFGAVVFPLSSPLFSSKLCFVLILASWVVAMAFHSPYFFVLKPVEDGGRLFCTVE